MFLRYPHPFRLGVRFTPKDEDEYRVVQKYLTKLEKMEQISWFCYSRLSERSVKVATRKLSAETKPEEITQELAERGHGAEYIRLILTRGGYLGCIFMALITRKDTRYLQRG